MPRLSRVLAALLAALSVGVLVLVGSQSAASAAPACVVTYQPNQWAGGFTANVGVTNNGAAITAWTVTWTYTGSQQVTSGWNADVRQTGRQVTAKNVAHNGSLATGASTQFGFQATFQGTNDAPVDFALNGVACNDQPPITTTTTTTTTTPNQPGTCPAGAVCDDFERQTGTTPSGLWTVGAANCTGTGTVSVDTAVAHGGSRSVRVDGKAGYCNHAFFGTSVTATSVLRVRYFLRHTTPLPASHVTTAALKDSADNGRDLRFGGQNQALQWNRESDDATLPAQSPAGVAQSVPLPVNQWTCVEFEIDRAGGLRTWLDSREIAGLKVDGVPTPDVDQQWLARSGWRPAPVDLRLGWESYGEGSDTLWFDDVVISGAPIGC